VFCWVLQTAETIVQGLNFPNLTPRLEKMPWSKMLFNNQSTITGTQSLTAKKQCSEVSTMALAISFTLLSFVKVSSLTLN
jgi:hypothetical protein